MSSDAPPLFDEIVLSDDEEKTSSSVETITCKVCSKDMTLWMNARRDIHVKVCHMKHAEREKERKAQRKSVKKLTEAIEKDDQVLEKPSLQPKEPQRSGELSKNNVKFARIAADDEENRKRKRPRSFAVVELAPKKCQCEVLTTLHSRFIDEFHSKAVSNKNEKQQGVTEQSFQMKKMIDKLSRYEQLSSDMQKAMEDTSDISTISLNSSDGFTIKCPSVMLRNRTSMMKMHPRSETIEVAQTRDVLKAWVTFVFTAKIEWSDEEKDGVKELAMKYGPIGLENLIKVNKREEAEDKREIEHVETEEIIENQASSIVESGGNDEIEATTTNEPIVEDEEGRALIDFYASDDPFLGFGNDNEKEDHAGDEDIILQEFPDSTSHSVPQTSRYNVTMDSFDEWSNQPTNIPSTSTAITAVTPVRNATKPIFGSHVKILKTNDITPMPLFDNMEETELKERMKEIGMRPKGKKAMIQILKKAYTTLHPEDPGNGGKGPKKTTVARTKTLSERIADSPKKRSPKKTISKHSSLVNLTDGSGDVDSDSEADKTLNLSNDEREVGKICGDDIEVEDDDEDDVIASNRSGKSNELGTLKVSFLHWLRDAQNSVLYEHILSLQPVSLEEMMIRLEKAEGPLGRIGKGKLVKLLDMLRITYQLPQKPGGVRIGGFKRRL